MKILYHFRTRGTGAEAVHIAGIARAFESLGHSVVFSSPTGVDPRLTAGSSPYKDPQGPHKPSLLSRLSRHCPGVVFELLEIGYNLPAWWRNCALCRREEPGLIYERHAFFLVATAWLARSQRVPLVVEVNELAGDARVRGQPLFTRLALALDRITFTQAAAIVVVSPHLKHRIEKLGIPSEKIVVLPNGVNAADFATRADGAAFRERFGGESAVVVGFVGWFVEWHRLDRLLAAFAELAATRPALRLALVGEGTLRPALEAQARQLGVAERVVFAGAIPHPEIPQAIAAMEVCVVPHSNEYRSPIKLFESMGQGRLTIAPATEPIAMVIRDGENGLLFDPESARSLTETLARAVDDAALRQRLGEQARCDILAKHTWQQNARRVLESLP